MLVQCHANEPLNASFYALIFQVIQIISLIRIWVRQLCIFLTRFCFLGGKLIAATEIEITQVFCFRFVICMYCCPVFALYKTAYYYNMLMLCRGPHCTKLG